MSKRPKKRNKPYQGQDAKRPVTGPVVHRYTAVQRSRLGEWWLDHKRATKIIGAVVGVVILVIWLAFETIRLFSV